MAFDFRKLPRCGAKAKSRGDESCLQPAMSNGRCYWHGGKSTGPSDKGKKQLSDQRRRHGLYAKKAYEERKKLRLFLQLNEEMLDDI